MTSDELELFKEKVKNKPIEYLLEMRECLFRMKERIEKDYRREDTKPTYAKYINFRYVIRGEIAKQLDIINAELKRLEYIK